MSRELFQKVIYKVIILMLLRSIKTHSLMFNTEANDLKKLDFCLVLSPRLQLKIKQMQKMINFRHILVLSTHAIIL